VICDRGRNEAWSLRGCRATRRGRDGRSVPGAGSAPAAQGRDQGPAEAFATDAERLARFEREARALASLNHPNIVTIYSVEEAGGSRFLAMELVEGESLDAEIVSGGFELWRFFDLAISIADALPQGTPRACRRA